MRDDDRCPRCQGMMIKDLAGDISCLACGYEHVVQVPLDANPDTWMITSGNARRREPTLPQYTSEWE